MDQFFRLRIPRRWRLHRRGHSSTTAHDTPKSDTIKSDTIKSDTTKSNTPPRNVIKSPKSQERPTKTHSDIQYKNGSPEEDYFFVPSIDSSEEEQQPNAKLATEEVLLPREEFRYLQIQFFNAQSKKIKIDALEKKLKEARWKISELEHSKQVFRREFEEATEELRELRKRLENCQPPSPTPTDTTDGEISDGCILLRNDPFEATAWLVNSETGPSGYFPGIDMTHGVPDTLRLHLVRADKITCMNELLQLSTEFVVRLAKVESEVPFVVWSTGLLAQLGLPGRARIPGPAPRVHRRLCTAQN